MIVTDLDGTLLNDEKEISEDNAKAISEFIDGGGKFAIATGRSYESGLEYIKKANTNTPSILFNGGMIVDNLTGDVIWEGNLALGMNILIEILNEFPNVAASACWKKYLYS